MMTPEQEIRNAEAERWWQIYRDSLSYSKDYGAGTLRSLILINGGALIGLLSFLATSDVRNQLSGADSLGSIKLTFVFFVLGLILAIIGGGAGYFNFQYIALTQPSPTNLSSYVRDGTVSGWESHRGILITAWIGAASAILSGLAFLLGCWCALATIIETIK